MRRNRIPPISERDEEEQSAHQDGDHSPGGPSADDLLGPDDTTLDGRPITNVIVSL